MIRTRPVVVLIFALASACADVPAAPVSDMSGDWKAYFGHFGIYEMHLVQRGRSISGAACFWDIGVKGPDYHVDGDYPGVAFTGDSGQLFQSALDGSGALIAVRGSFGLTLV